MKNRIKLNVMFWLAAAVFSLSSCDDESTNSIPPLAKGVNLSENSTLGTIIVDDKGNTLYFFANDTKGISTCTEGCLNVWPIFYVEALEVGSGLSSTDFSEITRADGKKQSTYKGFPLYYFSPTQDGKFENPGETNGEAVNNVWFVAKPDYALMIANAQLVGHDGKNYTNSFAEGTGTTTYFVDANGRTVYSFINDTKDNNNFTAADLSNNSVWPIFYSSLTDLPSILDEEDFGEITVFGQKQSTYKGRPLYYFGGSGNTAGDALRGDNRGVSFPSPGVWPIVNATTNNAPTSIQLINNTTFGNILTDSRGRSLYFFTRDTGETNNCTGGCATRWPVFYTDLVSLPEGSAATIADFKEITLADGRKQTTYKGWPLYYFSTNGDGVIETTGATGGDNFGTVWYIAKPDYSLMIADAQLVGNDGKNYTSAYVEGTGISKYFVDGKGRTIYRFINDKNNDNNFTASDLSNNGVWPIFYASIEKLPSAMNRADFGEITVFGQKQLTYKGWPLYYFGQDVARKDNKGVSVPSPGVWPIINTSSPQAPI